eukprot:TRINITY_DN50883_c0_g1_i1.p1 TRINITY_DN50883_c0_g1~~TRINITY_DN50883_c0_g1_i1.p1  ORF type:complete len:300 (-),score=68.29 TRINITY_DN50883_c0_g1_i1:436-1335(-)
MSAPASSSKDLGGTAMSMACAEQLRQMQLQNQQLMQMVQMQQLQQFQEHLHESSPTVRRERKEREERQRREHREHLERLERQKRERREREERIAALEEQLCVGKEALAKQLAMLEEAEEDAEEARQEVDLRQIMRRERDLAARREALERMERQFAPQAFSNFSTGITRPQSAVSLPVHMAAHSSEVNTWSSTLRSQGRRGAMRHDRRPANDAATIAFTSDVLRGRKPRIDFLVEGSEVWSGKSITCSSVASSPRARSQGSDDRLSDQATIPEASRSVAWTVDVSDWHGGRRKNKKAGRG